MESSDYKYLSWVKQIVTMNPFSPSRLLLDVKLTGMSKDTPVALILEKLVGKVGLVIDRIRHTAQGIQQMAAEDRELLHYGALFYVFHRFTAQYDAHIRQQIAEGDGCCQVPFAVDLLQSLHEWLIPEKEALHYVALFFQMRRAYFFIRMISGQSSCIQDVRQRLWNNIFTYDLELYNRHLWNRLEDFSTMLLGETGTGKGLAASAIGRSGFIPYDEKRGRFSESFTRSFLPINLSQFSEHLIESELFGHRKGAFTGAIEAHEGVFSRCSPHGAIFLDEIGEVAEPVQVTLLQVLQERHFSPVGGRSMQRFYGRVIAATNKSLDALRQKGGMREDFYYRLCSDTIEMPPLRQRLAENEEEIFILLRFIIERIVGHAAEDLVQRVCTLIHEQQPYGYPWPGNIRELEQCVRRILLNNTYQWQDTEPYSAALSDVVRAGNLTAHELLRYYCRALYAQMGTYEAVAQTAALDRRTVKKYIEQS